MNEANMPKQMLCTYAHYYQRGDVTVGRQYAVEPQEDGKHCRVTGDQGRRVILPLVWFSEQTASDPE